jgi:hypothetical protein
VVAAQAVELVVQLQPAVPVEAVALVRQRVALALAPVALVRVLVVLPAALPTQAQRTAELRTAVLQMEGRPATSTRS